MAIKKGDINKLSNFKIQHLVTGILLWIIFAYILYAFFYMFREVFRLLTVHEDVNALLVLSSKEQFYYNLFFASLASSLGYMFSLRTLIIAFFKPTIRKKRFIHRRVLNVEQYYSWAFLFWFFKVAGMLGILYIMIPLQFDINFLQDFWLFLLLLPLATFLSTWPQLNQLLGGWSIKWLISSFTLFILMSFVFAFQNFINTDKINQNMLNLSIEHVYNLKKPRSQSRELIHQRSLISELYIASDSSQQPIMFLGYIDNKIKLNEIVNRFHEEREKLDEYQQDQLIPVIYIDGNITMQFVNKVRFELRKAGIQEILFSTGIKHSKYPLNHSALRYNGLKQRLYPPFFAEFESFLHKAEQLDFRKKSITLPESNWYRVNALKGINRIEINISRQGTTLNGTSVTDDELNTVVYKFVKKFATNYVIVLNTDDSVNFGTYINYLDLIHTQIDKLRNEASLEKFNMDFYELWIFPKEKISIEEKYPKNILEWTQQEKRLLKILEKINQAKQ